MWIVYYKLVLRWFKSEVYKCFQVNFWTHENIYEPDLLDFGQFFQQKNFDNVFILFHFKVDARIRKSLAINLEECIVIVDEAHNVLRIFEDSSSASFTAKDVAVALSELDFVLEFTSKAQEEEMYLETLASMPNLDTSQVYSVKDCLSNFEKSLNEFTKSMKPNTDYTGAEVIKMFEGVGITAGNAGFLTSAITNILEGKVDYTQKDQSALFDPIFKDLSKDTDTYHRIRLDHCQVF